MIKISEEFPNRFLVGSDLLDRSYTLTIRSVTQEDLRPGGSLQRKTIVWFHETDKGLILNRTNAYSIEKLYGDDTDNWTDAKINIKPVFLQVAGQSTIGIRIS